jgi:hypothetical protein
LHLDDARCQKCNARLVGSIQSFAERLTAEENFHEAERKARAQAAESAPVVSDVSDAERSSPTTDLLNALFLAWVLKSGLARQRPSESLAALIADVEQGKIDVSRLRQAWHENPQPFSREAVEFATYYLAQTSLLRKDFDILCTAHVLGADRGSLARYSAILDRRLGEWRARGEGVPLHAM